MKMIKTPDYPVIVTGVNEVIFVCKCDASVMNNYLRINEGESRLRARAEKGEATVAIIASDLKWKGFHFNELVIGLDVEDSEKEYPSGAWLMRAYNSLSAFAWVERTFFLTPYYPAECFNFDAASGKVQFNDTTSGTLYSASGNDTFSGSEEEFVWESPIYLPKLNRKNGARPDKYYFARITAPMLSRPVNNNDIFYLNDSLFPLAGVFNKAKLTPVTKAIRTSGIHSRSKTFKRPF